MVYYKLGFDQIKGYIGEASRHWAEFGARKPILRKLSVILLTVFFVFILFGGLAPTYAPNYDPTKLATEVSNRFGISGARK